MARKVKVVVTAAASLLAAGAGAWWLGGPALLARGAHQEAEVEPPPPVAVTIAPATTRAVQRRVRVVGTLAGHEEVTVTPKVEGRVARLLYEVGDVVKPGELLLEIEQIDYELAVTEAERALEMELAKLGLKALPRTASTLDELPSVARARSVEENATRIRDRARKLRLGGATAAEEMDRAETELKVARAGREQALIDARATLATARHRQAVLASARQKLVETQVRAPGLSAKRQPEAANGIEWVVAQRLVSEGEMVRAFPSMAVFKLVIDRHLKLLATVPERHAGEVRAGQAVELHVEAYPGETFRGKVARVNPTVERANRTFQVEVCVPNPQRRLRAGSFARAAIVTRSERALTVPEEALVRFAGVTKLFVVRAGQARAVPVSAGENAGCAMEVREGGRLRRWVEVAAPVPPGTPVVTSGHSALAEGTAVRVR
jgi:RND family efflux transporter MFP subunit